MKIIYLALFKQKSNVCDLVFVTPNILPNFVFENYMVMFKRRNNSVPCPLTMVVRALDKSQEIKMLPGFFRLSLGEKCSNLLNMTARRVQYRAAYPQVFPASLPQPQCGQICLRQREESRTCFWVSSYLPSQTRSVVLRLLRSDMNMGCLSGSVG